MNLEIKQPEPGTPLPVVVHEWSGEDHDYQAGYDDQGHSFVEWRRSGYDDKWFGQTTSGAVWSVFALLGLPLSIKTKAVVE